MVKKYWCPDCDRRLRKIHFRLTPFYCCWRCKKIWIDTELEEGHTDLNYRINSWLFGVKHEEEGKEKKEEGKMRFRKRPVIVEAIQFTGDNADEFKEFVGAENIQCYLESDDGAFRRVSIKTDSGINEVCVGDWVIKGTEGEVYPCKPDVFDKIYEKVDE